MMRVVVLALLGACAVDELPDEEPVPENQPPVAVADTFATAIDTELVIEPASLLANDVDAEGDAFEIVDIGTDPQHGYLGVVLDVGTLVFQPEPGFVGDATFTYTIADAHERVASTTVTIQLRPPRD